ncbi:MAG: GntR family transcriptional regulator [Anaerovoracaceae bacterium]|jgi:DNA-binding GntR family transcriptional regulator|nr:GntR family transcriptional regulator [Anaerovoracaceae bacterium]
MLNIDSKDHRPLRVIVYEELKMRILKGEIAPGQRLMEVETSEELGVSRTPVREAIKKLEKEGLVVVEPRRGTYAAQISDNDLIEILEVRESLEALAAQYAAKRMKATQKEKLKSIAEKYNKAVKDGKLTMMIKYDTEFHRILAEGSNNKTLINLIDQLRELLLRFRYLYYDNTARAEKNPAEHQRIIDAIMDGDEKAAHDATLAHIGSLKEIVLEEGLGS